MPNWNLVMHYGLIITDAYPRFGLAIVNGEWISNTEVTCTSPRSEDGFVNVEIRPNLPGEHFTTNQVCINCFFLIVRANSQVHVQCR